MSAVLDKEAWRYSERAWNALHAHAFAQAGTPAALPGEIATQLARSALRGVTPRVFVNGYDVPAEFRLRDGERLHLVFVSVPAAARARWQCESAITLEHGSAEIIEQHIGVDGAEVLGELKTHVHIGEHARLRATTVCDLPDAVSLHRREHAAIGSAAAYASTHGLFGGRLQRFDLDVEMTGTQASYESRGVFVPRGRQHIDVHLDAKHAARATRSNVSWRGVADQRGRGILHGAITVASGADGADAQLQTKNLLLSPHAEIDAQPVLEIYADEVKASHGATVGQLDQRALFYLRSRGVPLALARNLLIAGFCREVLTDIADADLRAHLEAALIARLPQAEEIAP